MSIIGSNKNKLPKLDAGLDGMAAFRALIKQKNIHTQSPQSQQDQKNKLFVTYTLLESYDIDGKTIEPKDNEVFYHADIQHFDKTGHLNTGTTVFHVNKIALQQQGEEAVKLELNKIVAEKMKLLLDFKIANS
jgi:hypothetical protein